MYLKENAYRSERWRRAVASLPCVVCMKDGPSQAAHRNTGKGMGIKAPDVYCFPMCPEHHAELDQGGRWTKQERRELETEWVLWTVHALAQNGLVVPK